jgi:hypothetical protein
MIIDVIPITARTERCLRVLRTMTLTIEPITRLSEVLLAPAMVVGGSEDVYDGVAGCR